MPSVNKETIDDFQNGLKQFLVDTIKSEKFDIVIPIMRKGFFLLETLFPIYREFDIVLLDTVPDYSLANKKILILDDSARTGRTIKQAKQAILDGVKNKKEQPIIRLAVFLKHKKCTEPIDYYCKEYDDESLLSIKDQLSGYFDSLCHQLDPDHLVVRAEITQKDGPFNAENFLKAMKEILKKKGTYYVQDSVCTLWRRTKFAVCDLNPADFGLKKYSKYWCNEGVCKARFCFEQSDIVPNILYTVPIFCPEIIPSNGSDCCSDISNCFCSSINI